MSGHEFNPLVKELLDGDITLADLPSELRGEGEAALRLLAAVDRTDISMPAVTWRVMTTLERRRRRFLLWLLAPALAIAAALVIVLHPRPPPHSSTPVLSSWLATRSRSASRARLSSGTRR